MKDLKECPFCGNDDIRFGEHQHNNPYTGVVWSMCCYKCGATFPNRYKKALLVDCWNRRNSIPISTLEEALNLVDAENIHIGEMYYVLTKVIQKLIDNANQDNQEE